MSVTQPQPDPIFNQITDPLGDELNWRWEEKFSALLSEFSWEKKERVLDNIRLLFTDEWHRKNYKRLPKAIKTELGDLAKCSKEQLIFTRPATDTSPAIALIWWPWGHGGTYSIRIKMLDSNYDSTELNNSNGNIFTQLLKRFH